MKDTTMTDQEKFALRAIITALSVPRNRFGKLETDSRTSDQMHQFAMLYHIPHGGYDTVDKAVMILQGMVGDPFKSIMGGE